MDNSLILPPLDIPELLRQHGLRPKKRLGQNFLVDPTSIRKVVESAELEPADTVVEIGAGLGNLTRYLANIVQKVIAIEVDIRLIPPLNQVLASYNNVQIIQDDILNLNPADLVQEQAYKVTANIPYYITSAVIRHLLETRVRPQRIVLTVQREVAERICANSDNMNLLALSVQVFGNPTITAHIPAGAFYPTPKVDSAIVRINLFQSPRIPIEDLETFFHLIRAGFSQKRKTLRNALAAGLSLSTNKIEDWLKSIGVDPRRRAETLNLNEWSQLVQEYHHLID